MRLPMSIEENLFTHKTDGYSGKIRFQVSPRVACRYARDLFRRTASDEISTRTAGLWTKVNDIIGRFNDVEIMFHDNEGMARLDQSLKTFQQFLNVVHMQSDSRLIEDKKHGIRIFLRQIGSNL
ncbi:MAG: hypothetical protein BROFUL_01599 [Candidatus Brocadia fulgida]|uniref:Uncharacterized protein n=1 Tax=Candidatus Brocadia fulgida TaxID=380242 RepID=A0A0M2UV36_9BACT|nr:MAG: hypothetical protein BROFUL_01599 [Candidatus Brocadia fulgida]